MAEIKKRLLIGMSGASGAPLTVEVLKKLQKQKNIEKHLIITKGAALTLEQETDLCLDDIQTYDISESMTIPLKTDEDGEPHFCMVSVTLSMNTKDKGFKTYGADLSGQESLIKSEVIDVFGQYTLSEARESQDEIRQEILQRVQKMFDSEFIFNISFSNILFQ